jgi:PAS domain S-box-containing protein
VGLLSLGVTGWLWQHERALEQRHLRDNFDFGLRQTSTRIEQRMVSYEQMLRGLRGLFEASDEVTAQDFAGYVDALLAGADFAGLRNMGYVRLQGAGGPAPVALVAPAPDPALNPIGRDLWADAAARAAMQYAANSGHVAITRRLQAGVEGGGDGAFLMFMPLYRHGQPTGTTAQRQANAAGWVMAAFRIGDLMSSLYGEDTPGLEVRIHDGLELSEQTRIYPGGQGTVAAGPAAAPRFQAQEYLGFAGQTWTVLAQSGPAFEQRYASDSARIIAVAGGGLSAALALLVWLLLTGRQRAHDTALAMTQELRDSTERYRRIVETANEGIWTLDAAGRTSFVNPKMAQLLGCTEAQMLGRPWADFASAEASSDLGAPREVTLRRQDGGELAALLSTSPITDAAGRHQGLLVMVTDVSERRLAESHRAALEVQLRQSQKMEAIGTLAGGIAHDFNNVLAAILGNVALLQRAAADEAAQAPVRLQQIGQAAARARSLVQQIVAFSRQQPQQLLVQPVQPLLEETLALLRSTMPAGVELVLQGWREPLWLNADGTQLQQVLMNLCTNAWHALRDGSGRIEVGLDQVTLGSGFATEQGLQPGPHVRIWVVDNGCGMDEATRLRVFEPFFTTKPVGRGTGLGLSVVHGIVASHHGSISVASAPGQGSRFEMLFPLAEAPAAPAAETPAAAEGPTRAGRGEVVLYVDDDPVMGPMVQALLQREGYAVQCLDDPRQALQLLADAAQPLQLLITDFNMPELSGLELAREAARLRPGLPVVISSGFISDELRLQAQAAGVRHLLAKEYTLEQLGALVQRALGTG